MELLVSFSWVIMVVLGYFFGTRAEKKHYISIARREEEWLHLPTTASRYPLGTPRIARSELAMGSVVISVDYFKRMLGILRGLIGGSVHAYETLLDRARREAVLRLKESCPGASQILNLRLETVSLSKNEQGTISSVEVLAYGTAIYCDGGFNTAGRAI